MNKRGITWETIVYAIIGLVVLITLIWIFRSQISEVFQSLTTLIKGTTAGTEEVAKSVNDLIGSNK